MRCWEGGTGLEGNSRGNPVMSHGPEGPDKLLIRPVEGGQAGAGSTRDMSLARHAQSGQAREESPGAARHQPWPAPAITAGTDMPRLTGPLMARRSRADKDQTRLSGIESRPSRYAVASRAWTRQSQSRAGSYEEDGRGAGHSELSGPSA